MENSRSPFDYVKSIMYLNEYMMKDEYSEGDYISWIVNRALSVHADTIFYAQDMNMYPNIPNKLKYDYLFYSIRKTKRKFITYPKHKKNEDIAIIMDVYKYNSKKAKEALAILSDEQIQMIKDIYLNKGG